MAVKYRTLTAAEIDTMTASGCVCAEWGRVLVSDGFLAVRVCRTSFYGDIRIGRNDGSVVDTDGYECAAGIYDSVLADVVIGDNVLLRHTSVSGYDIGDGTVIEATDKLVCSAGASFGNGVRVSAINEGGGREVVLTEGLGAQVAYLSAMYRHRPKIASAISELAIKDAGRGTIGKNAKILGCGIIRNVKIGDGVRLEGAALLSNGTIGSTEENPSFIGDGVSASDFMCAPGAKISGGVSLERCWVGEACILEKGFTAVDSLFFANSHMACGEAVSVFAGPYSVSHHKSSLLIAGYFLFFNAGSGSNQSNHLFRTGPVHQGIHERGCKFGSNAYIMLPAREGAFTTVIGRHTTHHDTADMPYSFLTEEDGKTFIHPGAAIRSYGFGRDAAKWPARDRRGDDPADLVHFDMYNPYTGMRLIRAVEICRGLLGKGESDTLMWNRVRIKRTLLSRGLGLYEKMLDATIGHLLAAGTYGDAEAFDRWTDISGMFAPKNVMDELCDRIEAGNFADMKGLNAAIREIYDKYPGYAYAWALGALKAKSGKTPGEAEIREALEAGRKAHEELEAMRTEDAGKDGSALMMTGYGIDAGGAEETGADFENVRNRR